MIKLKNIPADNLTMVICYITQSGYKVIVESQSKIPVYDVSILAKGDDA